MTDLISKSFLAASLLVCLADFGVLAQGMIRSWAGDLRLRRHGSDVLSRNLPPAALENQRTS